MFFYPVQSGRPSQRLQQDTTVSLFFISTLCYQWTEWNRIQKFPPSPHPSCPFSFSWFGSNIFFFCGRALTLSVLIILPRISGLYSQILADYQAECEINPLTARHWCSAACWEHHRALGLELFCTSFSTAGAIKTSSCNFTVCFVKFISILHQVVWGACTRQIREDVTFCSGYSGTEAWGSFKAWTLC